MLVRFLPCLLAAVLTAAVVPADDKQGGEIDATTLHRKVLCGYQGWFRCPGDPAGAGWRHWTRSAKQLSPDTLTFEMWPDLSEYAEDEKYLAPGFTDPAGKPAHLFSSANLKTVERHFRWMQQYGIDGVFLQRFVVNLRDRSQDQVLAHVRKAAERTGRTFALCYDLTGAPPERLYELLTTDWKRLVEDARITRDRRYLHHNGKPVLFLWGFYSDRFRPELANRIIDFFQREVTLIGGCQWYWRTEKDPAWAKVFRRFDIISPWNVGNYATEAGKRFATTGYWPADIDAARQAGMAYLPVIYPGFAWTNLKGRTAAKDTLPRLGGEFFWRQFSAAAELGLDMAYVAMFDEVDEGTAIFKVSNQPPTPGRFATYDNLPTDWYLRLTGEGAKLLRGERKNQRELPLRP